MIKIVYLGTPDIAVKSLQELSRNKNFEVVAVVTQPDRPKGRGNKLTPPPVKVCALENNIQCFQTERISKDVDLMQKLKEFNADFFVTFAFGQILSQEVLDIPKIATVNLHASLLPKYRGANPIQRCIYNGDCKTGITTMLTVLELDAGDICEMDEIIITENMTSAKRFQERIDSVAVYVNASTRFTDGGEFGFGAEIGISTQKLHVRGPMGLSALTTEKYLIDGDGSVR